LSSVRVTIFFHIGDSIGLMPQPLSENQKEELKALGARIKAIREKKGMTLQEVAHTIGKDRQSIHRLEKGDFNPSYIYLLDVCRGLGISIVDLI